MKIRKAIPADAESIAAIHVASWKEGYIGLIPESAANEITLSDRKKLWMCVLGDSHTSTIVSEVNGEISGFISMSKTRDNDNNADETAEIIAIYLHPEHWRKGHGKALVVAAEDHLRKSEFKQVSLWVLKDNHRAREFYSSMGYGSDGNEKIIYISTAVLNEVRYVKMFAKGM